MRELIQVEQFVQAAKEDAIGTYAVGAMERVVAASEEATKTIKASSTMCVLVVAARAGAAHPREMFLAWRKPRSRPCYPLRGRQFFFFILK